MKFLSILRTNLALRPGAPIVQNPEDFAAAGGELLVISLLISWALTYLFRRSVIEDNHLKRRVGYNNLCVGWDEAPAKLVAGPIFVMIIWFNARYMQLDLWRSELDPSLSQWQAVVVLLANFSNAISWVCCILIFVVSPNENATLHTFAFVQLVFFGYLAYVANFLETDARYHPRGSYIFLFFFGLCSVSFGACAVIQFLTYDEETQTPGPIPWYITAASDYSWFVCLGVQGYMRPRAPSIRMNFELASDDDFQLITDTKDTMVPKQSMADFTEGELSQRLIQAQAEVRELQAQLHKLNPSSGSFCGC